MARQRTTRQMGYPVRIAIDDFGESFRIQVTDGLLAKKRGNKSFTTESAVSLRDRILRWLHNECSLVGLELRTVHVNSSSKKHASCSSCESEGIIFKSSSQISNECGGA